jgi:hypothetical protein
MAARVLNRLEILIKKVTYTWKKSQRPNTSECSLGVGPPSGRELLMSSFILRWSNQSAHDNWK